MKDICLLEVENSSGWLIDAGQELAGLDEESNEETEQSEDDQCEDGHQSSADHQISSIIRGEYSGEVTSFIEKKTQNIMM